MNEQEGDTEFYDGFRIETEWDSHAQRFIASARKESVESVHAIGVTKPESVKAVKAKIRARAKLNEAMGS